MHIAHGTVVSGRVVLDEPKLADGTEVYVFAGGASAPARLSPEELAEIEAGLAEADRGEMISGEELFGRLRRHG